MSVDDLLAFSYQTPIVGLKHSWVAMPVLTWRWCRVLLVQVILPRRMCSFLHYLWKFTLSWSPTKFGVQLFSISVKQDGKLICLHTLLLFYSWFHHCWLHPITELPWESKAVHFTFHHTALEPHITGLSWSQVTGQQEIVAYLIIFISSNVGGKDLHENKMSTQVNPGWNLFTFSMNVSFLRFLTITELISSQKGNWKNNWK